MGTNTYSGRGDLMKYRALLCLFTVLMLLGTGSMLMAQEPTPEQEERVAEIEENLKYEDFMVKAYRLTYLRGDFSGATMLDLPLLGEHTILTDGATGIIGYDGEILPESLAEYQDAPLHYKYDSAQKTIESGPAHTGRVGIYISKDFHLDLNGTYASGKAVTTMIGPETINSPYDPDTIERREIDSDDGFKAYKGGLSLMYDAHPASFFGIVPQLGFGLGGIINRFSHLEDKTALYLEGNFGLTYEVFDNFNLNGGIDVTSFAYEVDELGYSNMINYTTYSLGVSWFIDVVPNNVRAAHLAELNAAEE